MTKAVFILLIICLTTISACSPTYPDRTPLTIIGSGKQAAVPRDLDSFDELWRHIGTDNTRAIAQMVVADRVMLVPAYTKAQLVGEGGPGSGLVKIRIIEGKYANQTGFLKTSEFQWDVK